MTFIVHTMESAPSDSRPTMEALKSKFGFLPNLAGVMAGAPATLQGYATLGQLLESSSFSPMEQQLVLASVSWANACEYCVAAHSAGLTMTGIASEQLAAVREGRTLDDARLEALRRFTVEMTQHRGRPEPAVVRAFFAAGFDPRAALEVILAIGMKTIGNYVNHLAETPLDRQFAAFAWDGALAAAR
ncbi:MAG: carboxymuconolactone decarboxylase family protein [Gemmatimonadales bacterium]